MKRVYSNKEKMEWAERKAKKCLDNGDEAGYKKFTGICESYKYKYEEESLYADPPIYVECRHCQQRYDENEIIDRDINIEEDTFGRDVLTFICPKCGVETRSLRFG